MQGVGYRDWMVARALGLAGWVCNRATGVVRALVAGDTPAVEEMLRRCRRGARAAMVTSITETWCYPSRQAAPFGSVPNTSSQAARRALSTSTIVTGIPSAARLVTP